MKKRQIIFSVALLIFLVFFIVPPSGAETIVVDPSGDGNYISIQAAINAATAGDTILIRPEEYREIILIDKQLTLQGEVEDGKKPILTQPSSDGIPPFASHSIIKIVADSVTIKDLSIRPVILIDYTYTGIMVEKSRNSRIENCTFTKCLNAIWLKDASDNKIINNQIYDPISPPPWDWNHIGIYLTNSRRNIIEANIFRRIGAIAMILEDSHQNELIQNDISMSPGNVSSGILLFQSNNNRVIGNTFRRMHELAIYIMGSRNLIFANDISYGYRGIRITNSEVIEFSQLHADVVPSGNRVLHNLFKDNYSWAISFHYVSEGSSPPNIFYGNTIVGNNPDNDTAMDFPQVYVTLWSHPSTELWDSSSLFEPAYGNYWGEVEDYDGGEPYLSGKYLVYENPMVVNTFGDVDNFPLVENPNPLFIRGDANADGRVDLADAIRILNYLFLGGDIQYQVCADVNADGIYDLADAIYLLNYLFVPGSPAPPEPFQEPGLVAAYDRSLWPK